MIEDYEKTCDDPHGVKINPSLFHQTTSSVLKDDGAAVSRNGRIYFTRRKRAVQSPFVILLTFRSTLCYDTVCKRFQGLYWACTGFDGGFEVEEAIRGLDRVSTRT